LRAGSVAGPQPGSLPSAGFVQENCFKMSDANPSPLADSSPEPATSRPASVLIRGVRLIPGQILIFLMFVGVPALVTAIAPVSWIRLERTGEQVTARVQTCLLFVVPFKNQSVAPVTEVGDELIAGKERRERRPGTDRFTTSDDEGILVLQGDATSARVQVSPASLPQVVAKCQAFVDDAAAGELTLFVVANWKFSVIGGGVVSLLAVLYIGAVTSGLVVKFVQRLQGLSGVPPERRLFAKRTGRHV
jgi:hypothetical protein